LYLYDVEFFFKLCQSVFVCQPFLCRSDCLLYFATREKQKVKDNQFNFLYADDSCVVTERKKKNKKSLSLAFCRVERYDRTKKIE